MRALLVFLLFTIHCQNFADLSPQAFIKTETGSYKLNLEIANTDEKRRMGLMHRNDFPSDKGMLFVWNQNVRIDFWMKDTSISLDIIFLDSDFKVVSMAKSTTPFSFKEISSEKDFRYALEVKTGFIDKVNLQKGNQFQIRGLNF